MKLPILSPAITILATLLLIFVFLGATPYLYLQSSSADTYRSENAQQEWKRLHKYHGNPTAVIYEERKTPFFYDKQGNKCAFIRQGEPNH